MDGRALGTDETLFRGEEVGSLCGIEGCGVPLLARDEDRCGWLSAAGWSVGKVSASRAC